MRELVPELEAEPWPTLGPELVAWIEAELCHGPGDVLGMPVELTDELVLFLYRAFEVYPHGHDQAGRRRFKRVALSRRKGVGKTELAAWLAIAELDPTAPVRCDGFRKEAGDWVPVGRPVTDPYIPMVAVTEEQTEDLAFAAVRQILERTELGESYDVGLERVMHRRAPGKLVALASAPGARDGARTTFQHFDEPHLFLSPRLKDAHATMLRNVPKRYAADAWSLETTTMYGPGEDSIAELTHHYAQAIGRGAVEDPRLYFDHRQASEHWDLAEPDQLREAILEASGDAAGFIDLEGIVAMFRDPTSDENALRRYWLNQPRRSALHWGPAAVWDELAIARAPKTRKAGDVVLAFDGSYSRDSTVLIGATVEAKPYLWVEAAWERPLAGIPYRVPRTEVLEALAKAMETYEVVELAPDPPGWHREIEDWEATYGEVVVRFETNQPARMGPACDAFEQAARDRELRHDGSEILRRHLNNAVPALRGGRTVITKEHTDSPHKIDAAVGAVIAYARAAWHHTNSTREPLIAWGV